MQKHPINPENNNYMQTICDITVIPQLHLKSIHGMLIVEKTKAGERHCDW